MWQTCKTLMATAILFAVSAGAFAQDARRDQVAAATARALESLRAQIGAERIDAKTTVNDMIKQTGSNATFMKTIARAQQIGGPRWIDAKTCQVRLEIAGPKVARALVEIATLDRAEAPVKADVLSGRLRDWDQRTFSATGTSTCSAVADQVRPAAGQGPWAGISDDASRQAVAAARQNAVAQVVEAISPIPLAGGKTVGDALASEAVGGPVKQWLADRPITQVEFRDDLQVRVTLSTPPDELFNTFQPAAEQQKVIPLPTDAAGWTTIRDEFAKRVTPVTGRASAQPSTKPPASNTTNTAVELPPTPLDWVDQQLEVQGASSAKGSRLKTARAAEADAAAKLRTKVDALSLSANLTLGEAARRDPRIAEAVDRGMSHIRTRKVDYQPDGSASVGVALDLHDVWDELQGDQ